MGPDTEKQSPTPVTEDLDSIIRKVAEKHKASQSDDREKLERTMGLLARITLEMEQATKVQSVFAVIETDTMFHTIQISDGTPSPAAVHGLRMLSVAAEKQALKIFEEGYNAAERG